MKPKINPGHVALLVMAVILAAVAVSGICASLDLTETRKFGAMVWIIAAGSCLTDRLGPSTARVSIKLKLAATVMALLAFWGIWYTPALLINAAVSALLCGVIIWMLSFNWRHI